MAIRSVSCIAATPTPSIRVQNSPLDMIMILHHYCAVEGSVVHCDKGDGLSYACAVMRSTTVVVIPEAERSTIFTVRFGGCVA